MCPDNLRLASRRAEVPCRRAAQVGRARKSWSELGPGATRNQEPGRLTADGLEQMAELILDVAWRGHRMANQAAQQRGVPLSKPIHGLRDGALRHLEFGGNLRLAARAFFSPNEAF